MKPVEPVELTKDMIGDMFETRVGEIVCLDSWWDSSLPWDRAFPARFSDGFDRRQAEEVLSGDDRAHEDLIKHLPKSKYPEYYL